MRQSWRDLLFLHFACDPSEIAPLLPRGLSVDTFPDENGIERAWVGLVPFRMEGIRAAFAPPVPGTHAFPETNVRTYVHRRGEEPGVWFFSLDADSRLAVEFARLAFALPYFFSRMTVVREPDLVRYEGQRPAVGYCVEAILGNEIPPPERGSLDFFLLERYLLYSARGENLWSGRVSHHPYKIREASVAQADELLVAAAGIRPRVFTHHAFSEGVDVEIFPLRRLR